MILVDINKLKIKKILIIDLAFIGDVILSGPLTKAIRQQWPRAEIWMLTVPLTAPVAEMLPAIDRVKVYDKRGQHKGLGGMWQIAADLRQENFDLAVCVNFALRGAAVARLAGIPYRLGYDAQHGDLFLTWAASHVRSGIKHETENHLEVLKPLGFSVTDYTLQLCPSEEAEKAFAQKKQGYALPQKDEYYVLCPLGSYERKNLPVPLAVQLIRAMEREKPVFLIGGKGETAALSAIARAGHIGKERILAGTLTLPELAIFLREAAAMVSVDTGPMHIAQAMSCPTVAVFGPTDPEVWGPRNANSRTVYLKDECSPCWGKGDCTDNHCMEKIKAEQVLTALKQVTEKL